MPVTRSKTPYIRPKHTKDSGLGTSTQTTRTTIVTTASVPQFDEPVASTSSHPEGSSGRRRPKPYDRSKDHRSKLSLRDLHCVRSLGSGGFGVVLLVGVRRSDSQGDGVVQPAAQFAMKVVKKKKQRLAEHNYAGRKISLDKVKEERNIERRVLAELPWHPFTCGLVDTFVDKRNFYLMLEYAPCNSFGDYLRKNGPVSSDRARFYFTNIVLALEFLHSHDIVHRDIKPGNLLLGADGYLSLTDFGNASHKAEGQDWGIVGTVEWVAPEMHSPDNVPPPDVRPFCDWWAAAVTLYEMVTGRLPFRGPDLSDAYRRIMRQHIKWPAHRAVDVDLKDLVTKMLIAEPSERYGTLVVKDEGASIGKNDEVRIHPFLHSKVEWKKIAERRELAPYVPVPYPILSEEWFARGVPWQEDIPELVRAPIPIHQAWDNRCEKRRGR